MRKICIVSLIYVLSSCGSGDNNTTTGNDNATERRDSTDTKQPSGLDNSSVISTDTAAMKVQPKDSLKK